MLNTIGNVINFVLSVLPYALLIGAFVVLILDNIRQRADKMHNYNTCVELNNEAQEYHDAWKNKEQAYRELESDLAKIQESIGAAIGSRYGKRSTRRNYGKRSTRRNYAER